MEPLFDSSIKARIGLKKIELGKKKEEQEAKEEKLNKLMEDVE